MEKVPFFVLAVAASLVTFVMQGDAIAAAQCCPLGVRSGNALISYYRYLEKLFWPTVLVVFNIRTSGIGRWKRFCSPVG